MFKQSFKTELMQEIHDFDQRNVLDVRERDEYALGHIPNAVNMPMSEIVKDMEVLNTATVYTLVCQSGSRSKQVAQFLTKQGFRVINVMGGMSAYRGEVK